MSACLTSYIGDQLRPLLRAARRLTTPRKPPGNSFNFLSLMKLPGRYAPPSQELTCSIMVKRQSLVLQFRSFTAESPVGCTNERRMFASKVPIAITTRPYLRQTRRHRLAMRRTGHARSTVKRLRSTSERQAYIADQPPLTVEERMARGCPDCTAAECVDSSTRLRPIALAR